MTPVTPVALPAERDIGYLPVMRRLPLVLLASLLLACPANTGGTDPGSTGDTTGSTGTGSTDTGATDTGATATTGEASSTTSPTSGDSSTTVSTTDSDSGTTGEPAWCYGWEGAEGPAYLELHGLDAAPLNNGGKLQLECGPQGLFMFGLYPTFGGFTPPGDQISFDIVVDVAGNNTNPDGHFYSISESGYYIGCDPIIGGVLGVIPIIPPDNVDVQTLDGLGAYFKVVLHTANGDVVVEREMVLAAKDDGSWEFCGG